MDRNNYSNSSNSWNPPIPFPCQPHVSGQFFNGGIQHGTLEVNRNLWSPRWQDPQFNATSFPPTFSSTPPIQQASYQSEAGANASLPSNSPFHSKAKPPFESYSFELSTKRSRIVECRRNGLLYGQEEFKPNMITMTNCSAPVQQANYQSAAKANASLPNNNPFSSKAKPPFESSSFEPSTKRPRIEECRRNGLVDCQEEFQLNTNTMNNFRAPIQEGINYQSCNSLPNNNISSTHERTTKWSKIEQCESSGSTEYQREILVPENKKNNNSASSNSDKINISANQDEKRMTTKKKRLEETISSKDQQINDLTAAFIEIQNELSLERRKKEVIHGLTEDTNRMQKEYSELKAKTLELTRKVSKPTETIAVQTNMELETNVSNRLEEKSGEISEEKIKKLKRKLAAVSSVRNKCEKRISRLYQENKELSAKRKKELERYLATIKKKEKNETKYNEKNANLTEEKNDLKSALPGLLISVKTIKDNSYELSKFVYDSNEKMNCEFDQIKQNTLENVERIVGTFQKKLEKQTKLNETQKRQLKKYEEKVVDLNQRTKTLSSSTAPLLIKNQCLQQKIGQLETLNKELTDTKLKLQQQLVQQQKQQPIKEEQPEASNEQMTELKRKNTSLEQRITYLKTSLQCKDGLLVEKQNELAELQTRLDVFLLH